MTPLLLVISIWLVASGTAQPTDRDATWDAFRDRFLEAHFEAQPAFAASLGLHAYDGRLPDWSGAGLRSEIDRLHAAREEAMGFEGLDEVRRFERDLLVSVVDRRLFWIERARAPWTNPLYYFFVPPPGIAPDAYLGRAYAPLPERMRAFVRWAESVPRATAQIRENLREPMSPVYAGSGAFVFGGLAGYVEGDAAATFAPVDDPELRAALDRVVPLAASALRELAAWLGKRGDPSVGFALGPELYRDMLRSMERVDLPLARLEAIGREELARLRSALDEACQAFAPGATIEACVDRAGRDKPVGGPITAARAQLGTLEAFVRARGLVTIPPGAGSPRVVETPPHLRTNFAFIDLPGPYETVRDASYYITPPDPRWSAEEREAYLPDEDDLLFTSAHEVWPGHYLQFLHSNRHPSPVARAFVGYGFSEGWAHYAEEMMWEAGLGAEDPEARIGLVLDALLRNVRYLASIGLHTDGMTIPEAERMFREVAWQDPGNARQQAIRGALDPGYLNYTLGKLMIRRLRDEWTSARGGREAWRAFHDAFLSYGGPPIPLVREAMLGPDAGPPL